jgi:hypothetical protein
MATKKGIVRLEHFTGWAQTLNYLSVTTPVNLVIVKIPFTRLTETF